VITIITDKHIKKLIQRMDMFSTIVTFHSFHYETYGL
jgi:hypothetical protein